MDVAGFEFLLTRRGQRLLDAAMTAYDDLDALALSERLRSMDGGHPAAYVAAALTQAGLRRSAATKFGADAERMYFTPAGLEQATHPTVANHRAARAGGSTGGTVLDLGCGIGSDLAAFARAGLSVAGVDSDDVTARVAAANLRALGLRGSVATGRAEDVDLTACDVAFVDPARRRPGGRIFDPRAFSPPWGFVLSMLEHATSSGRPPPSVVAKLAPGLDHQLIPADVEAEWVSLDGELKEVALWSPTLEPAGGRRRATLLTTDGGRVWLSDGDAPTGPAPVANVGRFLYEPDPAVVRAHLVASVAADLAGWLLDPHIAYISCDREVASPYARGFRVLDVLPFREKALRAALRSRGIGALTIKKRGIEVTPEDLRRRLSLRGDGRATLILSRTPASAVALLVEALD